MYQTYWGLSSAPFDNRLSASAFYESPHHEEALARLFYCIEEHRSLAVLHGPAGCGKTTMLIQLAQCARIAGTPFMVELPAWTSSRRNILEYVGGMPAFQAEGLTPADLARHDAIAFVGSTPLREWSFGAGGNEHVVAPPTRLAVNNADVAIAAAIAGHGLTRVLSYQAADALRTKRLRRVLAAFEPPALPIHIVHAEGRRAPAKLRAFVDFLGNHLPVEARGVRHRNDG